MLINYTLSQEDNDKITNTVTRKSADNSPLSGIRIQLISEIGRDMETQLGKAVTIEVNRGSDNSFISLEHWWLGRTKNSFCD